MLTYHKTKKTYAKKPKKTKQQQQKPTQNPQHYKPCKHIFSLEYDSISTLQVLILGNI